MMILPAGPPPVSKLGVGGEEKVVLLIARAFGYPTPERDVRK
jgi:hypothetical protein